MSVSRISPAARIVDVRAGRVLGRRRQPADHRVARVLRAPVGILFGRRRFLRDDRVLEPGGFERGLPALDALLHVRHPLRRRRRIDPVDDRLHRFRERRVRIFLLQPPARDVAALRRAVLVAAVVQSGGRRSSRRARRTAAAASASPAAAPCCSASARCACRCAAAARRGRRPAPARTAASAGRGRVAADCCRCGSPRPRCSRGTTPRARRTTALASNARAPTRVRPLNSGTSVVNSRVTSITAASSLPSASMLNAITIGL